MNLYDYIWKRKSTRKYDLTPLPPETLAQIEEFAQNLKPLYGHISTAYEITDKVRTTLPIIKAPHYIIISSEQKEGYLENVGFLFQQMDLFLASLDLGSCWYGASRPIRGISSALSFVIIITFGKAINSPHRAASEFKRKPLAVISSGDDSRLEAARLAPSGVNFQNWFFEAVDSDIHVFQKKGLPGPYTKLGKIDIGIALCHLYLATEQEGKVFHFVKKEGHERKGYFYTGTVKA